MSIKGAHQMHGELGVKVMLLTENGFQLRMIKKYLTFLKCIVKVSYFVDSLLPVILLKITFLML